MVVAAVAAAAEAVMGQNGPLLQPQRRLDHLAPVLRDCRLNYRAARAVQHREIIIQDRVLVVLVEAATARRLEELLPPELQVAAVVVPPLLLTNAARHI